MASGRVLAKLYSNWLFPAYHLLQGDGLWPLVKEYEISQWRPSSELRVLQQEKLRALLLHCRSKVPYYRELFAANQSAIGREIWEDDNFSALPFLTKTIINQKRNELIAENSNGNLTANHTSGSTGESLHFYQDRRSSLHRQAVVYRNLRWMGCLYTDKEAKLWGARIDISKSESLRAQIHACFDKTILLSSYELSDQSMAAYVRTLQRYKPRLLVSYASPLAVFAQFLLTSGERIPGIRAVVTSAETLFPWQRELIAKAFDRPVYDRYGCREFGTIAHECETGEGYHLNAERFLVEILDEAGAPVKPGEIGEIFITDLDNFGFPFIRYRIGDLAEKSGRQCSCGRGLPLLGALKGRSFDIVRAPNGNRIGGTFWTLALRSVRGVRNFQVEQTEKARLVVRIEKEPDFSADSEQRIRDLIIGKCSGEMKIDFKYLDKIPLTASGKHRFVISRLAADHRPPSPGPLPPITTP